MSGHALVNNHHHYNMQPCSQTHDSRHGGHHGLQITNTPNTRAKSEDMECTKRPQFCHLIFVLQFFGKKKHFHIEMSRDWTTFQFASIIPPSNCKLHKAETLLINLCCCFTYNTCEKLISIVKWRLAKYTVSQYVGSRCGSIGGRVPTEDIVTEAPAASLQTQPQVWRRHLASLYSVLYCTVLYKQT